MKARMLLGSVALIGAIMFPSFAQASTSSGIFGSIAWKTTNQLNTRNGKYAFAKGLTWAQAQDGGTLIKTTVIAELHMKNVSKPVMTQNKVAEGWPNPAFGWAAEASQESGDYPLPGAFYAVTKHSFSAVGISGSLNDMTSKTANL